MRVVYLMAASTVQEVTPNAGNGLLCILVEIFGEGVCN